MEMANSATHYMQLNGDGKLLCPLTQKNCRIKDGKIEVGHTRDWSATIYWNVNSNVYHVKQPKTWLAWLGNDEKRVEDFLPTQEWFNSLPKDFVIN